MSNDERTPSQSTEEKEGADARRIGVPIAHNPYEVETHEYDAWERGWRNQDALEHPLP